MIQNSFTLSQNEIYYLHTGMGIGGGVYIQRGQIKEEAVDPIPIIIMVTLTRYPKELL